jgi:hypothetical protein
MTRQRNIFWEVAKTITDEMGCDPRTYDRQFAINRAHLSSLCNPQKSKGGVVYNPIIVLMAWRQYKAELETKGYSTPSIYAILKDGRIDKYVEGIKENVPPVYLSHDHDEFVMENADILKSVGFVYRAGRIPLDKLEELGLQHEQ